VSIFPPVQYICADWHYDYSGGSYICADKHMTSARIFLLIAFLHLRELHVFKYIWYFHGMLYKCSFYKHWCYNLYWRSEGQTIHWPEEEGLTTVYKTLLRKLKIEQKTGGELKCSGRVHISCSTSGTRQQVYFIFIPSTGMASCFHIYSISIVNKDKGCSERQYKL
jgi:hypothetical protein